MNKRVVILFLSFLIVPYCMARQLPELSVKDSIGLLLEFAKNKMDMYPDEAAELAQRASTYAKQSHLVLEEADASLTLGKGFFRLHQASPSIAAYEKAARIFHSEQHWSKEGSSYHGLSNVYIYELHNYARGFEYCKKAHELLKGDSAALQPVLSNMAALYMQTRKYDEALTLFKSIFTYWQRQNKLPGMAVALNNIATVYEEKKEVEQSILYYKKALEVNRTLNATSGICTTMLGLANAHCLLNEHEKSEILLKEILTLSQQHAMKPMEVQAFQFLAEEKNHLGDVKAALKYGIRAETLAQTNMLTVFNSGIYEQLSRLYNKNGDVQHAFEYQQKHLALKDTTMQAEHEVLAESVKKFNSSPTPNVSLLKDPSLWIAFSVLIFSGIACLVLYKKRVASATPLLPTDSTHGSIELLQQDRVATDRPSEHHSSPPYPMKLEVLHGEGIKLLSLQSIWWIQKEGKNYHAFTESENYRIKQNISDLEETLPKEQFFRVNRAAIINTSFMSNYSFWENHKYIIRMKNADKSAFTISRSRLRELKETLQQTGNN